MSQHQLRYRLPLLLVLASLVSVIAGCDQSSSSPATPAAPASPAAPAAGEKPAPEKPAPKALAELKLGYFPNLTHAQAVLGVASGEIANTIGADTKLTTKTFNAGPAAIEALFAGEVQVTYIGPSPVLNGWEKSHGEGIRVVGGAAANGVVIVASKDSGITSLADLKGKKLATPQQGNTQDVSAKHYLKAQLAQADVANVVPVANAEQSAMMARGQIDASWAPEPWGSFLVSEAGAKIIGYEKDLWPDKKFTLTLIATTPEFLRDHPDVIEKLLTVHRSWTSRLQADPTKYVGQLGDALYDLTKKKLPAGVLQSAIANVEFTDEPLESSIQTFNQWAFDLGLTKKASNLTGLVDVTILRKLQNQQPAATPVTATPTTAPSATGAQ